MSYIHYEKDKSSLIHAYYLALIPLFLFGFYKNGILLYQNELISFIDMFIPLYFYGISILIGFLIAMIRKDSKKEYILYGLILACTISMNTNMIFYPILLFVSLFIASYLKEKVSFNGLAFTHLLLLIALFMGAYSYFNVAEKIDAFNYNLFDIFLGFGSGGIASTSFLCLLIGFLILCLQKFYKKMIPVMASISFFAIILLLFFITKDYSYLETLFNGTVYFGFVFVGADIYVSPDTKGKMMVYGACIGIFSALLSIFIPIYEVSYISIFILSFFIPLINQLFAKKDLQF